MTVRAATVVALVDGGSERVVSAADALVLDASESYDPDVPPGEPAGLEFYWTCRGEACPELDAGSAVQRLDGVAAGTYAFAVEATAADGRTATAATAAGRRRLPFYDIFIFFRVSTRRRFKSSRRPCRRWRSCRSRRPRRIRPTR